MKTSLLLAASFILIFTMACSTYTPNMSVRSIAQAEYLACHDVQEELLIEEVNFSEIPKNFAHIKKHVFQNHCASCHFGKDSYQPHLDDYESLMNFVDVKNLSQSRLLVTISSQKMPPSYNLLSRDRKAFQFLKEWVSEGAQKD
jgi:hypothetical protein